MQNSSGSFRVSFIRSNDEWLRCPEGEEQVTTFKPACIDSSSRFGFIPSPASTFLASSDLGKDNIAAYIKNEVKKNFRDVLPDSLLYDYNNRDCIAPFKSNEVKTGRLLGSGEFSHVYEIKSFLPDASVSGTISDRESEMRQFMKEREKYRDTKKARFALKHLRPELDGQYSPSEYAKYACDIVQEAEFLSVLQHPNIIKLRGICHQGSEGFANGPKGYFLVIDSLEGTLDNRIAEWKRGSLQKKSSFELLKSSMTKSSKKQEDGGNDEPSLLPQQLEIALQIAAALVYLHSKNIIFRDLKPENIGLYVDLNALCCYCCSTLKPNAHNTYSFIVL
jgi:hypothetical protein